MVYSFIGLEKELLSKLLVNNYYNISRLFKINVSVFLFNLRSVRMFLVLKSVMLLDNICAQKPNVLTYDLVFNYKKSKVNYLAKVTLRKYKKYEYLNLYKFLLFSEFVNNHFKIKTLYDSFKFKKLIIIPFLDEGFYKTSFYIRSKFFFSGLEYQKNLIKQCVII